MFDPSPYLAVLRDLSIGVSAGTFVEFLKASLGGRDTSSVPEFQANLDAFLKVHGATVDAQTVINAFAAKGLLSIQRSTLTARDQVVIGAGPGAQFEFGNDSASYASNTSILVGQGAQISGSNAAIVQNPDGSISFNVGGPEKRR